MRSAAPIDRPARASAASIAAAATSLAAASARTGRARAASAPEITTAAAAEIPPSAEISRAKEERTGGSAEGARSRIASMRATRSSAVEKVMRAGVGTTARISPSQGST